MAGIETTMPNDDLLALVGRLTEAQRIAILRHLPTGYHGSRHGGWPGPARDPLSWSNAGRELMNLGLLQWNPSDRRDSRTRLTRRGQAVRAHLEQQSRADSGEEG